VPPHEILLEAGRRRYVGGQEDMLIDVALSLAEAGATLGGDRE
jgi:4-hydroxy 2-oxovalerate aldolase